MVLTLAVALGVHGLLAIGAGKIFALIVFLLSMGLPFLGSTQNMTTFNDVLKDLYDDQVVKDLSLKNHNLLKWWNRRGGFYGRKKPIPIKFANPQGTSKTFSKGKTNKQASKYDAFDLTRTKDYGFVTIDNETIMASENDKGAFLSAKTTEIDGIITQMGRRMSIEGFRNTVGIVGQISAASVVGTATITLANIDDIMHFEVGQTLEAKTVADGTGAVKAGSVVIEALDRDLGTITVEEATWDDAAGIPTVAAGDYLFIAGDYGLCAAGAQGWLPLDTPTAGDDWFSVDRSTDDRLSGVRLDATGLSAREACVRLLNKVYKRGGNPDALFCPSSFFNQLELELDIKVQYFDPEDEATGRVGFAALKINYEGGVCGVMSDVDCESDTIFALQRDTWQLEHLGEAPTIFRGDGNTALRSSDEDGIDIQCFGYYNIACDAPGWNGTAEITPTVL
jgi:hypothetical protein